VKSIPADTTGENRSSVNGKFIPGSVELGNCLFHHGHGFHAGNFDDDLDLALAKADWGTSDKADNPV
jgi:hypothetical protein